jgi:hypothetical protein
MAAKKLFLVKIYIKCGKADSNYHLKNKINFNVLKKDQFLKKCSTVRYTKGNTLLSNKFRKKNGRFRSGTIPNLVH